ncbi:GNAT family N-acetyltransferase [Vibrio sp. TH_r3]|uniref:GNAT family N-acetyltransferase n=1 Tax=Vibrio sp. TH_r3 TaxID=3082084 RepID=UPI002952C743|nr:GNAT family N-acetyltransferase [Vibrio sp. TH_r3]MDV7105650.1 GNAT family N-acetyltransferase [Vibrio sp. TH_r3]
MITWQRVPLEQLSTKQLYEILKIRVDVFIVEQNCAYPDLDGIDLLTGVYQLIGYEDNEIVAVARLMKPGLHFSNASIGRIAVKVSARKKNLGHMLVKRALEECHILWPEQDIDIQAQEYLLNFYQQHGFKPYSESYLEDGIPHVDMRLRK